MKSGHATARVSLENIMLSERSRRSDIRVHSHAIPRIRGPVGAEREWLLGAGGKRDGVGSYRPWGFSLRADMP